LHGAGFEVDATRTTAEALDRGALRLPTAAIIELVLPHGDGVEVCRRLREWSAMPVIPAIERRCSAGLFASLNA
jgi:two-component system KDP operon response regulator KdpE